MQVGSSETQSLTDGASASSTKEESRKAQSSSEQVASYLIMSNPYYASLIEIFSVQISSNFFQLPKPAPSEKNESNDNPEKFENEEMDVDGDCTCSDIPIHTSS